jgi:hypothetical protein
MDSGSVMLTGLVALSRMIIGFVFALSCASSDPNSVVTVL